MSNYPQFLVAKFVLKFVAICALMGSANVHAQQPQNVTRGEMALLPDYCEDVQGFKYGDATTNTSPRAGYWVSLMGQTFWHQHHYCWGLIKVRRATAAGTAQVLREGGLKSAVSDYEYVVNNSSPGFVLLPEVYLRIGEAQLLLNNLAAASDAFAAARKIKPDYWPAYVQWAEVLMKYNKNREALALLEECMRNAPNEPAPRAVYLRMGGNLDAFLRASPPSAPAPSASAPR